jgi:hypothetical protein
MQKKVDYEIEAIKEELINEATEMILVKLWGHDCIGIRPADNPRDGILMFNDKSEKTVKNANLRFWKNMKRVFLEAKRFCDERIKEIMEG